MLLDEMFSPVIATMLCERGHDVEAVAADAALRGAADQVVFEAAVKRGRVVVTSNVRHFRPLNDAAAAAGREVPGVVFVPGHAALTRARFGQVVDALDVLAGRLPGDANLMGAEAWLPLPGGG